MEILNLLYCSNIECCYFSNEFCCVGFLGGYECCVERAITPFLYDVGEGGGVVKGM